MYSCYMNVFTSAIRVFAVQEQSCVAFTKTNFFEYIFLSWMESAQITNVQLCIACTESVTRSLVSVYTSQTDSLLRQR